MQIVNCFHHLRKFYWTALLQSKEALLECSVSTPRRLQTLAASPQSGTCHTQALAPSNRIEARGRRKLCDINSPAGSFVNPLATELGGLWKRDDDSSPKIHVKDEDKVQNNRFENEREKCRPAYFVNGPGSSRMYSLFKQVTLTMSLQVAQPRISTR